MVDVRIPAIITDVDGTLTKGPLARDIYDFDKSLNDLPNPQVCGLVRFLSLYTPIIVLTGRSERYREITQQWLTQHNIPYHHLYMRDSHDQTASEIMKEKVYVNTLLPNFDIQLVFEDWKPVVDMWQKYNLNVVHVQCEVVPYGI